MNERAFYVAETFITATTTVQHLCDFRLPPRSIGDLRYSVILRSV
jgi:hypothetical protein